MKRYRCSWSLPVLMVVSGCQTPGVQGAAPAPTPDSQELVERILELYRAFDFDAGGEPDWEVQRELSLSGATFLPPVAPGRELIGEGIEPFIEGFRAYATSKRMTATGLHERVTHVQGQVFGGIAVFFVTFEGHLPGEVEPLTHGVDGLSFVKSAGRWQLVSFTSQYESEALSIPPEFQTLHWTPEQ